VTFFEMQSKPFIQISQLRKIYPMGKQTVRAVDGIDLDIPLNAFTVIMGPSGSGKTTLLYQLGGLDRPSSGSIAIDGVALEKLDENGLALYRRKKIGFIFQSFNLVSSMTALENIAFPLRFSGIQGAKRNKIASQFLRQVGLEKWAHHRPTELSGGQQQRVAIARSLVNSPSLILADEPTGNLDSATGLGIMRLLSDLHHQNHTIVVVTHDPRMLHFATDVVYLMDGHVVTEEEFKASSISFESELSAENPAI
jgi:putative ABC transport system ATP-binding protein